MAVIRKRKRPARKDLAPLPPPTAEGFIEIASRSRTVRELQILWKNAREMGLMTEQVQDVMRQRAAWLNQQHKIERKQ